MNYQLAKLTTAGDSEISNTRYVKYMGTIIEPTFDPDALDNSQCFVVSAFETDDDWRLFYTGATTQPVVYAPDGRTYDNVDQTFLAIKTKSNDVRSGWNKVLDVNGDPKPVFQPSFVPGQFDNAQVWLRSVLKEGSTLHGWYVGDIGTPTFVYKIGYATSSDDGLTWTKYSTSPVYSDALTSNRGIPVFKILKVGSTYYMFYSGIAPNTAGFCIAQSTDRVTWTKTHSGLLANQNYGYIGHVFHDGTFFYAWIQKNFQTGANLGPAREMRIIRSSDLTNWTDLGRQLKIHPSGEFGLTVDGHSFQKPDGTWFFIHFFYKGRIQALAGTTIEPSQAIRIAEINSTTQIANSECIFEYPDYVTFYAPLGFEMQFSEMISNQPGSINSSPNWVGLQFIRLNGSQTITYPNVNGINGSSFGVKLRVQIVTTGTHVLFSIGSDVVVSLSSGKLRVRLSSNGAGYEKDYITTVNISKPVGIDYIDDHIYVGFIWNGTTIRLFNDFVEFTTDQITKTVDNALTTVNNSGSNILLGQNAAIEMRSVSVLSAPTVDQYLKLDI